MPLDRLVAGPRTLVGIYSRACLIVIRSAAPRSDMIANETGSLVGVMTAQGRHLSKARGESFAA